jgi:nucleoside-diphosphate-sugar epimerase
MTKIAILGGTGYLASLIKDQNNVRANKYSFFSRKKNSKSYINQLLFKKDLNILKNFDIIIHSAGPNENQLKKNDNLIKEKNRFTSRICDLCLAYNIKLIYISSLQIYKNYGKNDLSINSKINLENIYSRTHYESEKIIISKFLNHKKIFTILRMGNVFGFKTHNKLKKIDNNLIHSFCSLAVKKKEILLENGHIQRSFIPSQVFIQIINSIIKKNLFRNSIENISYKNFNLKDIAKIIQKRFKILFNSFIQVKMRKFRYEKKFKIYPNCNFKLDINNNKIYFEIDQILKIYKKI